MNTPLGWKKVKFSQLAKEKSNRIEKPNESDYERYVGLDHMDSGNLVIKRWGSTKDVTSAMKLFNENDILFARRNTHLRRVSVAKFDGVCSGDIIVIEPILNEIVEGFLPIYMQFEPFENRVISLSAGAFSKRIKWKQLAEEDILIPSKEEQQRIVDLIWSVEDNIEKTEKLISINEKLKKGLLNELLTKGIGHKKFKKTELGELPDEWAVVELSKVFDVITGTTPSTKEESYWSPPEINWYTPLDLGKLGTNVFLMESNKKISRKGFENTSLKEIPEKTIIISTRAPVGYIGITTTKSTFNQGCKAILPKEKESSLFYADYLIYSKQRLESYSGGSTFKELTKKSLEEIKIIHPPYYEQLLISDIIKNVVSLIMDLEVNKNKLYELKKKLTDELISGRLRLD